MAVVVGSPRSTVRSPELGTIPRGPRLRTWDAGLGTVLALAGYWSPWLALAPASLRLNGYDLAEWIAFLPGTRDGSLTLTRLSFLAPLACLALLVAILATRSKQFPVVRWGLVLLALVCAYNVFPAYPYLLTAYADPEFQLQFYVACATVVGVLLTTVVPLGVLDAVQIVLALGGAWSGARALLTVRPAAMELMNGAWPIGIGWGAMLVGFGWLTWAGWRRLVVRQ